MRRSLGGGTNRGVESSRKVFMGKGHTYMVRVRREGKYANRDTTELDKLEGRVLTMKEGWKIERSESRLYAGETAMLPNDFYYPDSAPDWIPSGDLYRFNNR